MRIETYCVRTATPLANSLDFWKSGLLDLWVRQLDARADDCEHKGNVFYQGRVKSREDLTVGGRVEGSIDLGDHNLWVAPHGEVNAVIHAKNVIIAGALIEEKHSE